MQVYSLEVKKDRDLYQGAALNWTTQMPSESKIWDDKLSASKHKINLVVGKWQFFSLKSVLLCSWWTVKDPLSANVLRQANTQRPVMSRKK